MQDPSQQLGPTESTGEPVEDRWVPSALEQERAAYRSARTRRSAVVATASTLAMLGAIVALVVSSPGWPRVKETFFSWDKAVDSLPAVLDGLWLNIRVMLVCAVLIAILGLTLAVMRTVRGPVAFPLRLFATAYVAEVFRAGIESVHPSQRAAARSLGLSYGQTLRHVVLPQAVRRVVPALMNDLVSLQKDSGLIAVLGVIDAIRAAQIETASDFNYTPYVVAGALFVCLTIPMARFTDWVARRQGFHGAGGHL